MQSHDRRAAPFLRHSLHRAEARRFAHVRPIGPQLLSGARSVARLAANLLVQALSAPHGRERQPQCLAGAVGHNQPDRRCCSERRRPPLSQSQGLLAQLVAGRERQSVRSKQRRRAAGFCENRQFCVVPQACCRSPPSLRLSYSPPKIEFAPEYALVADMMCRPNATPRGDRLLIRRWLRKLAGSLA